MNKENKVRYAVVGAGWIAQEGFMPGVEKTGNSVMTALVTGDAKKARELSDKYEMIEHTCDYDGLDALLKSGKIDAIYLGTPNTMHRDFTIGALNAGIHVLCEKPMAPTIEDCRAMIEAGKKTGAKLMIGYRCDVCVIKAIEKSIASGKVELVEQIARTKRPKREQAQKLPATKPLELVDAKPASQ